MGKYDDKKGKEKKERKKESRDSTYSRSKTVVLVLIISAKAFVPSAAMLFFQMLHVRKRDE